MVTRENWKNEIYGGRKPTKEEWGIWRKQQEPFRVKEKVNSAKLQP